MTSTNKRQQQSKKTIPKSFWKLPRDKKSKDEATNATKRVHNFEETKNKKQQKTKTNKNKNKKQNKKQKQKTKGNTKQQ